MSKAHSTNYVEIGKALSTIIGDMPRLSPPGSLFGRRLRAARLRVGSPQDKLGVMIGIDEGSSSARISRYETGIHEPPVQIVQRLAEVLQLPTAYFYCEDDRLADLVAGYFQLDESAKASVEKFVKQLTA